MLFPIIYIFPCFEYLKLVVYSMARGQRSKIRQRRRAPLRAKYEERQRQALIIKHQLLAIKKASESKEMEVSTPQKTNEDTSEKSTSDQTIEVTSNKPSKSKLKKMKEARKRKKLGIKKGRWKWT